MRTFFYLLAAFAGILAIISTWIHSNPVDNGRSKRSEEFNKLLNRYDQYADIISTMSSEKRAKCQRFVLKLVDFEISVDERKEFARQLLQKAKISKENKISWGVSMEALILITTDLGQQAPNFGKLLLPAVVKTFTGDTYVFGSQKTRKRTVIDFLVNILQKLKENPELDREMMGIKDDITKIIIGSNRVFSV